MSNIDDLKEELTQQRRIMERFCWAALDYPQMCEKQGHEDEDTSSLGAAVVDLRNRAIAHFEDVTAKLKEDQGISALILQSQRFEKLQSWITKRMGAVMRDFEDLEIPRGKPYTGEITKIFYESQAELELLYNTFVENHLGGGIGVGVSV